MERDHAADRRMAGTPALSRYLPRILLYPLTGHALGALLLFTAFLWIGLQSVLGIALLAVTTPWVFHYAESVIEHTSRGRATPPAFGGDMIFLGSNVSAFWPLLGVALVVAGWWWARAYGPAAEVVALALGSFLFPAFMLVLVIDNRLLAALNPLRLVSVIAGVGLPYFAVCAVLAAAAAGIVLAAGTVALALLLFLAIYLWLMCFHLLGYVAYHRADRLGLALMAPPPTDESRKLEQQAARLAALLRAVDEAVARKDYDAAGRALYAEAGGPADVRLFHEDLFQQLLFRRNAALIHAQGQRLVSLLLGAKRTARALDIAESCFDAHPDFAPERPAEAVVLAAAALEARRDGLFDRLVRDAVRRYARDPAAVSMAFLQARFAYERHGDHARAREILKPLVAQTAHPQHRQIAAFAKAIGK